MINALKICLEWKEKDPKNYVHLDFYRAKLYENMCYIYSDLYFYQTAKTYINNAKEIMESNNLLATRSL